MHYGRSAIGVLLTLPLRPLLLAWPHYSLAVYAFSSHVVYQPFVLGPRNAYQEDLGRDRAGKTNYTEVTTSIMKPV